MTIKDKLIELQIDTENNKQLVDEIKKALNDAGENASKITNKLTSDGEKIVLSLVNKSKVNVPKKNVLRPTTIKLGSEDTKVKDDKSKTLVNDAVSVSKTDNIQQKPDATKLEQSTKPFWEGSTGDNLKINMNH